MGGFGRLSAITSSVTVGAFLCVGIILLTIAATIVLSLISLYTPNHSEAGYGEQYQIKNLVLKALYQNIAFTFNNGTVADSTALSSVCGMAYQNQGAKSFVGCLAKNFYAFGPHNTSINSRRRRISRAATAGLYEIGEVNLYYSTSCGKKADKLKYANSTSLSSCVKGRLAACNNLVNGSTNFTAWKPLPTGFSQSILDQNRTGFHAIGVENLFGVPFATASSIATNLNPHLADIQLGCQYIGPLPQANITNAFLAQSTETTTEPTSSDTSGLLG